MRRQCHAVGVVRVCVCVLWMNGATGMYVTSARRSMFSVDVSHEQCDDARILIQLAHRCHLVLH